MRTGFPEVIQESAPGDVINTGVPKASAIEMYTWSVYHIVSLVEQSVARSDSVTDFRPYLLTRLAVAHVVDDEVRKELFEKLAKGREEIYKKESNNEQRSVEIQGLCAVVCGEVLAWLDSAVGVWERNQIAFIGGEHDFIP